MDSIGSILRKRRVERSLSLDEAHQATKITLQNLGALEDDRFDTFANRVYARAFLRDYANYLGLDSGELLERYETEWGPKDDLPIGAYYKRPRRRRLRRVAALVVVAGAAVAFAKLEYTPIKDFRLQAYCWAKNGTGFVASKLERHPRRAIQPRPPIAYKPPKLQQVASVPKHNLNLGVSIISPAWLRVETDAATVFEGILQKGQTRAWSADRMIRIRTGNAGGVRLDLNGKNLGLMGPPVQIRERVIRADQNDQ